MMKVDIDKLSEAELIDLNHRVVERLRFLSQMRAHSQMLDFKIGERVTFHPDGHPLLVGIVTRYNRKTVTVITDAGQHWNVAPGLLRRADSRERTDTDMDDRSRCIRAEHGHEASCSERHDPAREYGRRAGRCRL